MSDETDKKTIKEYMKQPLIIFILGVLAGNIDAVVEFIAPSLKTIFVTKEEMVDVSKKIKTLEDRLDEVENEESKIKAEILTLNAKENQS